jgi:hypothetical protein
MSLKKVEYDRRKANGLCVQCAQPSDGTRCQICKDKNKAIRDKTRERRKATGICTECPSVAKPGSSLCDACIQTRTVNSNKRYFDNKAQGTCRICGAYSGGEARCPAHKKQFKAWRIKHDKEKGKDSL